MAAMRADELSGMIVPASYRRSGNASTWRTYMLECGRMTPVSSTDSPYRVTLFFGPEPVEQRPNVVACVFNVKRRSWKAGIQVSVEVAKPQLSDLEQDLQISNRIAPALKTLEEADRQHAQDRLPDLFAQAVSWCKLDLRLNSG